jgi:hypothetical protein
MTPNPVQRQGKLLPLPLPLWACAAILALTACQERGPALHELPPMDPQVVQDQDDMTWDDYVPIPGRNWADPSLEPERGFKLAVVAIDFPDQPFVITLPEGSDPFGNPQIDPVAREDVPAVLRRLLDDPRRGQPWSDHQRLLDGAVPGEVRDHGGGGFRPLPMPNPLWYYGLNEYGQQEQTPDGSVASGRMERDCDSIWAQDVGVSAQELRGRFDAVLRVYAGYDETGVWQEFGEMKFDTRDDIPPEWGNPNPDMPRWIPTRYVEWTSWLAGAQQWGLSSMRQGENSGTITHELGHFAFRLPDLNNNPYVEPYRRVAAGNLGHDGSGVLQRARRTPHALGGAPHPRRRHARGAHGEEPARERSSSPKTTSSS